MDILILFGNLISILWILYPNIYNHPIVEMVEEMAKVQWNKV